MIVARVERHRSIVVVLADQRDAGILRLELGAGDAGDPAAKWLTLAQADLRLQEFRDCRRHAAATRTGSARGNRDRRGDRAG